MSADNNKQPSGFDKLMGELETMTKALPAADVADDKKIQAAAGADDDDKPKLDADGKPIAAAPMTKSLQVTLADGTVVEAEDGTELVKSLMERVGTQEDMMVKALGGTLDIVKAQGEQLKSQGDLIKSLQETVGRLGNQGAGRKTIVDVHQQVTALTKSVQQDQLPTAQDVMAKANAAFTAGKINGQELTQIDVALRMGQQVDPGVLAKAMA